MTDHSDYEKTLLANVDEHGWHHVFVADPAGDEIDFGYSVGFSTSLKAPEFIICGLPYDLVHSMLWAIYRQIKDGAVPSDGMRWQGLLQGCDCISRKVIRDDDDLFATPFVDWYTREAGRDDAPEVYQMVWPGVRQGLFPWDDDCDQVVKESQPNLWSKD